MFNTQEYIIIELEKRLESMIFLTAPRLKILVAMIIGIIGSGLSSILYVSQKYGDTAKFGHKDNVFLSSVYIHLDEYNKNQAM
ncbi:hypothetical protein [Clostridium sp.]|mgnify:CR=1 FL=1|uniref:hypothetical protein n=1 Tax=Clostridium sp. TaxID=1506 RepID=UPI002FDEF9D0